MTVQSICHDYLIPRVNTQGVNVVVVHTQLLPDLEI